MGLFKAVVEAFWRIGPSRASVEATRRHAAEFGQTPEVAAIVAAGRTVLSLSTEPFPLLARHRVDDAWMRIAGSASWDPQKQHDVLRFSDGEYGLEVFTITGHAFLCDRKGRPVVP